MSKEPKILQLIHSIREKHSAELANRTLEQQLSLVKKESDPIIQEFIAHQSHRPQGPIKKSHVA